MFWDRRSGCWLQIARAGSAQSSNVVQISPNENKNCLWKPNNLRLQIAIMSAFQTLGKFEFMERLIFNIVHSDWIYQEVVQFPSYIVCLNLRRLDLFVLAVSSASGSCVCGAEFIVTDFVHTRNVGVCCVLRIIACVCICFAQSGFGVPLCVLQWELK